jgi:hypothetical protein
MADKNYKIKYVSTTAINMIAEINETLVTSAKMGREADVILPGLFDRAFMIANESAIVPMIDWIEQEARNF